MLLKHRYLKKNLTQIKKYGMLNYVLHLQNIIKYQKVTQIHCNILLRVH